MTASHVQKVRRLYKMILKLHRSLPPEMRIVGDMYAREEFKRHKACLPPEATVFMNEWSVYAMTLAKQLGIRGVQAGHPVGKELSGLDLDNFREEQIQQLYELMLAATDKSKPPPR